MILLTQSLRHWLFQNHPELIALITFGHKELFTPEMQWMKRMQENPQKVVFSKIETTTPVTGKCSVTATQLNDGCSGGKRAKNNEAATTKERQNLIERMFDFEAMQGGKTAMHRFETGIRIWFLLFIYEQMKSSEMDAKGVLPCLGLYCVVISETRRRRRGK